MHTDRIEFLRLLFRSGARKIAGGYHLGGIHAAHVESARSLLRGENGRHGKLHYVV